MRDNAEADFRVTFDKGPAHRRQQRLRKYRQAHDRQLRLLKLADAGGGVDDAIEAVIGALHLFEQPQSLHGRGQAPAHPIEQLQPNQLFKTRQLAADGRLRGLQQGRRLGQVAGGHHRPKDFDLPQRDAVHGEAARLRGKPYHK